MANGQNAPIKAKTLSLCSLSLSLSAFWFYPAHLSPQNSSERMVGLIFFFSLSKFVLLSLSSVWCFLNEQGRNIGVKGIVGKGNGPNGKVEKLAFFCRLWSFPELHFIIPILPLLFQKLYFSISLLQILLIFFLHFLVCWLNWSKYNRKWIESNNIEFFIFSL